MKIFWDEPKRLANIEKHGLDFADIGEFAWESALFEESLAGDFGSRRFKALGYFRDGTAAVIFCHLRQSGIRSDIHY